MFSVRMEKCIASICMHIIILCLALDYETTEKHCLMATNGPGNGCLSCSCSEDELASSEARLPTLVESVVMKIEDSGRQQQNSSKLTDQFSTATGYRGYRGSKGWDKKNEKRQPFFEAPGPARAGWAALK
jgi:hypothetical protein